MLARQLRRTVVAHVALSLRRTFASLDANPHIHVFPDQRVPGRHLLSLLPSEPPSPEIAIGTTSENPPTSTSLTENARFSHILQSVIGEHAHNDPEVQSQAQAMASAGGSSLGVMTRGRQSGISGGGASDQGGMGSGGRGGWIHVSDQRNIPDIGRIPYPEDIFGSVEVDGAGNFVDGSGGYQPSGTYRIITRDGILGLSDYLRERLIERLKLEEAKLKK